MGHDDVVSSMVLELRRGTLQRLMRDVAARRISIWDID